MADIWYDVDTALSEVPINLLPLIDDTDFKSREESVTYNQSGLDLVWNFVTTGGAMTQTAVTPTDTGGNYDFVNQGNGLYTIEIPASGGASINNDTEGFGWFTGFATGILPWRSPVFGFRAAGLNNALIDSAYSATRGLAGTALPDAAADAAGGLPISDTGGLDLDAQKTDVASILADTGTDGVLVSSGTGAKQISLDAGKVLLQATQTGVTIPTVTTLTNLPAATTDWLTAAAVKADAVTKIQANLALEATLTAIKGTGWTNETLEKIYADVSDTLNNSSITEENIEKIMGVGWTTETLKAIKTVIDAIKAKTDNLPSDPADDSDLDTAIAAVKTVVDAVKLKTDNIPASPAAVGSAMTLANNAITAAVIATDAIDADAIATDAVTEIQTGITATVDAASIRTAIGMASADLDTQLDAILALGSGAGTGDMSWTYTLTETDLTPIADATVWVTSDEAGASILAAGTTNASGQVTFMLNAGATVYVWAKKFGWEGTNPDVEVVS